MMTEHPEENIEVQEESATPEEEQLTPEDQLRLELHEANEARLRALADFKNYQRRSIENEGRAVESGMTRVVRSILPLYDQTPLPILPIL